jgi:hypothetical protein
MSAGNGYENKYLDAGLGDDHAPNMPATVYIALFTAAPDDSGGGTEVAGGSYARESLANNSTNWPAASGGFKSNGVQVDFAVASANWGTVTHFAIMDHATDAADADNIMHWGPLAGPLPVNTGDTATFPVGMIVIVAN